MLAQIRKTILQRNLIVTEKRILMAISGGADSTAMAFALHMLAPELGLELAACHLNHQIRGNAADKDAGFARNLAAQLGVPYLESSHNVPELVRTKKISLEMAAREARYSFFRRAVKQLSCGAVATGHTADDQAETFILKLARGAGTRGLSGISYRSEWDGLTLIRPILDISRDRIIAFLTEQGYEWCEDATNADTELLRNRVRHETIPFLERTLNPKIRTSIIRTTDILDTDQDWLNDLAEQAWHDLYIPPDHISPYPSLDAAKLLSQHDACKRRIIIKWIHEVGIPENRIDFDMVERTRALVATDLRPRSALLCDNKSAKLHNDRLILIDNEERKDFCIEMEVPGEYCLNDLGLMIKINESIGYSIEPVGIPGQIPASASFSADRVAGNRIVVRSRRPADRMQPIGLNGSKKLKDILIEAKLTQAQKDAVPVFEICGEIVWMPGYRIGEGWQVEDKQSKSVRISVEYVSED
ncbi:MAG: tRNA lysidine(34) synthetase TilS [Lentisphaerae bacterium]|nr:tRNA lysidine(34) synthetase TilS [Lentisphaerota bacterium]